MGVFTNDGESKLQEVWHVQVNPTLSTLNPTPRWSKLRIQFETISGVSLSNYKAAAETLQKPYPRFEPPRGVFVEAAGGVARPGQPSTLHPQPYTLNPQPYTLNPTPYTLHRGGAH